MPDKTKEKPEQYRLVARTMSGLEKVLEAELQSLGGAETEVFNRGVSFSGDLGFLYKANYRCRTALRILKPIKTFRFYNKETFYKEILKIRWMDLFDVKKKIAVGTTGAHPLFNNTLYASQFAKDAICDCFRDECNERPTVDTTHPDIAIQIHLYKDECNLFLDSSGESLHKRGYRVTGGLAPLSEVLAAGLIQLSGWKCDVPFLDPMCGSGTLPIEAAMIANKIPAGYFRKSFAFEHWKDFDEVLWKKIKENTDALICENDAPVYGSDSSERAIKDSLANAKNARMHKDIDFIVNDFEQTSFPEESGIIIMNPPYDERLKIDDILSFYEMIGDTLKKNFSGSTAWIITGNMDAAKHIGLKASSRIKLYNGPMECVFLKFDLYEGSKKSSKSEDRS
ncbi:MAG: THUMP domain-containing protein [Bacteroidota bacterium]